MSTDPADTAAAADPGCADYLELLRAEIYREVSRAIGASGWPCWHAEDDPA